MKFKLTSEQLDAASKHAAQRGMTLEEYIEEFIGLIHEHNKNNPDKPLGLDKESISD
jgi:predicted DNA binding CopG/RHH family protein